MRALALIGGALALFAVVLGYNWYFHEDWDDFARDSAGKLAALERDLVAVGREQAELARALDAAAVSARREQREYERRIAQEADAKARAVWGIRRMGTMFAQIAAAKQREKLDALRDVTGEFDRSVMRGLRAVQETMSRQQPGARGTLRKAVDEELVLLGRVHPAIVEFIAQMKSDLSQDASSLKDQQREIQRLMPVGVARADPLTDRTVSAVESVLKANESSQQTLERLAKALDGFGRLAYRGHDIVKAQAAFMTAAR